MVIKMKQAEKNYMISDASKKVKVEAHVLRYWEEELELPIRRNEMGHRYYTEEDIAKFCNIKELKEQGLQLKAIKSILKSGCTVNPFVMSEQVSSENVREEYKSEHNTEKVLEEERMIENRQNQDDVIKRHVVMVNKGEFVPVREESKEAKNIRLQQLLHDMIMDAVRVNNQELCEEIKESMLKELDYQFRLQEEKEEEREEVREEHRMNRQEEHYREIDDLLRSFHTKGRKNNANKNKEKVQEKKKTSGKNMESEANLEEEKNSSLNEAGRKKGLFRKRGLSH